MKLGNVSATVYGGGMTNDELEAIARVRRLLKTGSAKAIRVGAGVSQAELAGTVGVSKGTLSRWESGKRVPGTDLACRLSKTLDGLIAS